MSHCSGDMDSERKMSESESIVAENGLITIRKEVLSILNSFKNLSILMLNKNILNNSLASNELRKIIDQNMKLLERVFEISEYDVLIYNDTKNMSPDERNAYICKFVCNAIETSD